MALVSVLVMTFTGYGWAAMKGLVDGLNMADVLGAGAGGAKPADGARDILLVGTDSRTDAQGNPLPEEVLSQLRAGGDDGELNTDTLIFVHIPNDGSKANAISLPRDSYVDIPGGYGKHKINSAYMRAKADGRSALQNQGVTDPSEIERKSNQAGAKTLVSTVEQLTGSTIDNYAAINLLGFHDVTKAVGGVDVCLKDAVDDEPSGAHFAAGRQTISGGDALAFVRQRHGLPRGDLDRVQRQQVFMASLANKLLSAGTLTSPTKLDDLTDSIKKSVTLNQGWDIMSFAQQMKGLTGGQIEFRTLPIEDVDLRTPDDGSALGINPQQVHGFIQSLGGAPPPPPNAQGGGDRPATVNVRNASGTTGLAAGVSQALTGKGFHTGETANAASRKSSVVQVPAGQQAAGEQVAQALGGNLRVEQDSSIPNGQATVLLGTDYSGTGSSGNDSPKGGGSSAPAGVSAPRPQQASDAGSDDNPIKADGLTCVN